MLVDGAVRDAPAMAASACRVRRRPGVVGPNGHGHVVAIDAPVTIGAVAVDPADHVVVDATGCVRITAAVLDEVLGGGRVATPPPRRPCSTALGRGEPLAAAYRVKKSIVDRVEEVTRAARAARRQPADPSPPGPPADRHHHFSEGETS